MSKKIIPKAIDVKEQVQHSKLSDSLTAVVKKKICSIESIKGIDFTHIYEIDFHKRVNVYDFEDSSFCLEMTGHTLKNLLELLMLEPSLREVVLDYIKNNP